MENLLIAVFVTKSLFEIEVKEDGSAIPVDFRESSATEGGAFDGKSLFCDNLSQGLSRDFPFVRLQKDFVLVFPVEVVSSITSVHIPLKPIRVST